MPILPTVNLPAREDVRQEISRMASDPAYVGPPKILPDGMIEATRKSGTIETYHPTATAGKLDRFSVQLGEIGGGGGGSDVGGGTDLNPYVVLDKNLTDLWDYYAAKEKNLREYKLPPQGHNQVVAGMQAEYDQAKLAVAGVRTQLDNIRQGITSGQIDPELGKQAMFSLVLPKETLDVMYPKPTKPEQSGGFAPGEEKSYQAEFEKAGKSTIVAPWLSTNYSDPNALKEQYFSARATAGYDSKNVSDKIAFDLTWDKAMGADKKTLKAWKGLIKDDPDIKMSRTHDLRLLEIARKRATGENLSPMASSLKPKVPLGVRIASVSPVGAALLYRDLSKKRKAINQQLPSPKTQEEYDSIKSGQQYIGTDGKVRTKR